MTDKQQRKRERKARQAQAKAQNSRDKARRKLLEQRKNLARRRARNRRQSEERRDDEEDGAENPTAHSTMPKQKSNAQNAARNSHSTVPATPKYSNVPARERLYGQRLHRKTSDDVTEASDVRSSSKSDGDADEEPTDNGQS
jgi:hypothetical protein